MEHLWYSSFQFRSPVRSPCRECGRPPSLTLSELAVIDMDLTTSILPSTETRGYSGRFVEPTRMMTRLLLLLTWSLAMNRIRPSLLTPLTQRSPGWSRKETTEQTGHCVQQPILHKSRLLKPAYICFWMVDVSTVSPMYRTRRIIGRGFVLPNRA